MVQTYRDAQKRRGIHGRVYFAGRFSVGVREILQRAIFIFALKLLHRFVECECNAPDCVIGERRFLVANRIAFLPNVVVAALN